MYNLYNKVKWNDKLSTLCVYIWYLNYLSVFGWQDNKYTKTMIYMTQITELRM